jgi:hypothetical protein
MADEKPVQKRKNVTQAAFDELRNQALFCRQQIHETAQHVDLNMEAALEQIMDDAAALRPAAKRRAYCRKASQLIAAVKVKPRKGRLRDLRRLDELLAELARGLNGRK